MSNIKQQLAVAGLSASLILAGGTLVAPYEGKVNTAYKDVVGVWTQCYGNTNNVDRTRAKTDQECADELAEELVNYNKKMKVNVKVVLNEGQEAAFTSLVYNIGEGNWNKSTALKLLNEKKFDQACAQILRWNKAGGKVYKGLERRRQAEFEVCMGNNKEAIAEANRIFEQYKAYGYKSIDLEQGE